MCMNIFVEVNVDIYDYYVDMFMFEWNCNLVQCVEYEIVQWFIVLGWLFDVGIGIVWMLIELVYVLLFVLLVFVGVDYYEDMVWCVEQNVCVERLEGCIDICVGDVYVLLFDDGMFVVVIGCFVVYYWVDFVGVYWEIFCMLVFGGFVFIYEFCSDFVLDVFVFFNEWCVVVGVYLVYFDGKFMVVELVEYLYEVGIGGYVSVLKGLGMFVIGFEVLIVKLVWQ